MLNRIKRENLPDDAESGQTMPRQDGGELRWLTAIVASSVERIQEVHRCTKALDTPLTSLGSRCLLALDMEFAQGLGQTVRALLLGLYGLSERRLAIDSRL